MEKTEKKQGNIIAILAMIFLFAMIAFVTNLCSPMAVILKNSFTVPESLAQVGNYGNFGAYANPFFIIQIAKSHNFSK